MENINNKELLIVVPYRNRPEHLKDFLENTPKYFNNKNLIYDILICELDQQGDWNAGLCVNSLVKFIETNKTKYRYLYIHHVDIWLISGDWIFPKDNEVYFNMGDYGSCLLTMDAFFNVEGYSNSFWGWGGEDNELYQKLREKKYKVNEISNISNIKYETKHQSHERKFNGKNYANAIKQLMILPKNKRNNISNFSEHGEIKDFKKIENNIYKHVIIPKKQSPSYIKNNKVLLGYIKNVVNFENLAAYVKSAGMHMSYNFDMVMFISDENPDPQVLNQLEAFGVKCIKRKEKYENLFIDRLDTYNNFLENETYSYALHTDVTDVFFQADPFKNLDLTKITLTDEGIKIKEESWNRNLCLHLYTQETLNSYWENNVLCGGIIGAPVKDFVEFSKLILEEYKKYSKIVDQLGGIDQIYLNKIVHTDLVYKNKIDIKTNLHDFAINLHVPINYKDINFPIDISNRGVITNKILNKRYAIVHQYNRNKSLYKSVFDHYNKFYFPIT